MERHWIHGSSPRHRLTGRTNDAAYEDPRSFALPFLSRPPRPMAIAEMHGASRRLSEPAHNLTGAGDGKERAKPHQPAKRRRKR